MMAQIGRPRVVIADDHPYVLVGLSRLLRAACDVVGTVPTGVEAVEAVNALRPDVLVVDLMMPDLDGLEVCRRVKQSAPETDVIIVTAFDDAQVQATTVQEGALFLPKHSAARMLDHAILQIFAARQRLQPRTG